MKRAEPGWLVLTLAAIAAGIGSFLPFYTFDGGVDLTVWSRSLFPTATLIALFVVLIGLEALFVLLMGHEPRSPFLNLTWSQARLVGSGFAILLALAYLVQGRAGGSLGSGYIILSVSALGSYTGAVMARRAELARRREEIVKVEHPWRAAFLRWRREMTEKAQAFAAGNPSPPVVQPVPAAPPAARAEDADKQEDEDKDKESAEGKAAEEEEKESAEAKAEKLDAPHDAEEPAGEPTPLPRLSAVQSEPESGKKSKPVPGARKPATRAPKKAAAKKTVEAKAEPKPVEPAPVEPKPAEPAMKEPETAELQAAELDAAEAKFAELAAAEAEAETVELQTAEAQTAELETAELETAELETAAQAETVQFETAPAETAEPKRAEIAEPNTDAPPKDGEVAPTEEGGSKTASESEDETAPDVVSADEARERPAAPG